MYMTYIARHLLIDILMLLGGLADHFLKLLEIRKCVKTNNEIQVTVL